MEDDSINYVIATYSGKLNSRNDKFVGNELNIQLSILKRIIDAKKILNIKCLISHITVVCPQVDKSIEYKNYYDKKWEKEFSDIKFNFITYVGKNQHHSYDQWIQGYMRFPYVKYHLFMEDDYCIEPDNFTFDLKLIDMYKNKFPKNIGYLCSLFRDVNNHGPHIAI